MMVKEALSGWQAFVLSGKYPVLVLGFLLGLWMFGSRPRDSAGKEAGQGKLYALTLVGTILALLPPTAVLLMKYQTGFYGYVWIWNLVPMTAFLAMGLTLGLPGLVAGWRGRKQVAFILLAFMVLWMCGRMSWHLPENVEKLPEEEGLTAEAEILDTMASAHRDTLLWAPREIMEYAREIRPDIGLVYGRDMWDAGLGAYTYETYPVPKQDMYEWMKLARLIDSRAGTIEEHTDSRDEEEMGAARACGVAAAGYGVNEILLPLHILPSWREAFMEGLSESGAKWQEDSLGGYWRYYVQE